MITTITKASAEIPIGDHRGIVRKPQLGERDGQSAQADSQAVAGERREAGLEQNHQDQFAALCADGFEGAELFQVLQNERVEGLTRNGEADDEAHDGHDQEVHAQAGLEHVEVGDLVDELVFRQCQVAERLYLLLDVGYVGGALGLDQNVGDREARVRDVLKRPFVGRVERRNTKQTAAGHLGDAHDDAAVIVQLKFGSDRGLSSLGNSGSLTTMKAFSP